ncbi:MAG: hypothetical protein JJ897_07190 [Marinibacterium sp.]|nr:hypothetical protein [Marinibacterium sp.]
MSTVLPVIGWAVAIFMGLVTVLLAMNKTSGLKLIQHRVDMLPQALLVRYGGLTVLALIAAWLNAPRMLAAMLASFALIGFGDAFIYRRAGHPFWLHLAGAVLAAVGAILALFAIS